MMLLFTPNAGTYLMGVVVLIFLIAAILHQRQLNKERKMDEELEEQEQSFVEIEAGIHFKVEVGRHDIMVWVHQDGPVVNIPKYELLLFLTLNDRVSYIYDFNDPNQPDGHGQQTGKLTADEYYGGVTDEQLSNDVFLYLQEFMKQALLGKGFADSEYTKAKEQA